MLKVTRGVKLKSMSVIPQKQSAFTIVELLIVIVVIAILAAISIVAYNGIQTRARTTKVQSDLNALNKAIVLARTNSNTTLAGITLLNATASECASMASGTNFASLASTHACWVNYNAALDRISNASGMNVRGLKDPWNRPYFIYEVEGLGNWPSIPCKQDEIGVYLNPHTTWVTTPTYIPLYNPPSGC